MINATTPAIPLVNKAPLVMMDALYDLFSGRGQGGGVDRKMLPEPLQSAGAGTVVLGAVVVAVWLVVSFLQAVYDAHFSPLARLNLPGPYLARWTSLPYKKAALSGRAMYWLDEMVRTYGPLVRVAPNELAIGDPALARSIHAVGSGFLKAPFYERLADERPPIWREPMRYVRMVIPDVLHRPLGIPSKPKPSEVNLVATNNLAIHGARRRLYARPFSKQGILTWEPVLKRKTRMWVDGMRQQSLAAGHHGKVDIFKWLALLTSDTIAELSFGKSFGGLESGEFGPYMRDLSRALIIGGVMAFLPTLGEVLVNLPIPPLRHILSTGIRLRAVGQQLMADYLARDRQGLGAPATIFDKAMEPAHGDHTVDDTNSNKMEEPPREDAESIEFREQDARTLLIGGTDTTTTTLTYILWSVARSPAIKQRLFAELEERGIDARDVESLDLTTLRDLPYLNAILQEGLRLYGAGSGNLPRSVPPGGKMLGGYALPEGTVVNPQPYTLHRIESIFPEPERFNPERWLDPTPAMDKAFLAWSYGARICLGMHLARDEMLLGTVAFFAAFPAASVPPETTEAGMAMEHYFAVAPKAHQCVMDLGIVGGGDGEALSDK